MISMSIQLKIWKQLITKQAPLSSHHVLKAMSLLPPLAIYATPLFKSPNFCTETAAPSTSPQDGGVVTEFFVNKCGLTKEDITKAFEHCNHLLQFKSSQNCEEVLDLLNGCGLTTPAQIRRVTFFNPRVFFCRAERNIKSKFNFLRTFMKEKDIVKLIYRNAKFITHSEDKLKSAVSLLRKMGFDDNAISGLLAREPRLLMFSEKVVMESFKNAEDLGIKKGSKMFSYALQATMGVRKEKLDQRRLCFSSLGFSQKQILEILKRRPTLLGLLEENVKRNANFLVNSVGLSLDDFIRYPALLAFSLEKRIIPRYRVMEALKSMQVLTIKVSFPTFCGYSERIFFEKYIHFNAESSVLLDIYHGRQLDH